MRLKSAITLIIAVLISAVTIAQSEINYKHKSLIRTLKKAGISDISLVEEMTLPESIQHTNTMNGKFFRIKKSNFQYIYVGRVYSCRTGGCSSSENTLQKGNSEYFDYYMLFDNSKSVKKIKVFNYQASHGYEITSRGWLKQFIGYDGSEKLKVNKNIDAISGATISVNAITEDVEIITQFLKTRLN
ncbi:MAG: FMN-binding protein [Bacteroidales bacterium]|jgi:Na+-translocating ferredoxin:NAD+ oxidoreductase RnfG subunit|nr:FMN-binding protein [Bacteroidales bacterium]